MNGKKHILSWWKKWGTDDKDTVIIQLVAQKKESRKTFTNLYQKRNLQ